MVNGEGCECGAYSWSECGCGVDWRSLREVELEKRVKGMSDLLKDLIGVLAMRSMSREEKDQAIKWIKKELEL